MAATLHSCPFIMGTNIKMLLFYTLTVFAVTGIKANNSSSSISLIPPKWDSMCHLTLGNYTVVECEIGHNDTIKWRLDELGNWTVSNNVNVSYHLNLRCVDGASISLPWPFKSPGLTGLTVSHCGIEDYYKDYQRHFEGYPDRLETLLIEQCVFVEYVMDSIKVLKGPTTKAFVCGQSDSITKYSLRNNSIESRGQISDIYESNITDFNDEINTIGIQCKFPSLQTIENTHNEYLSERHFEVIGKDRNYPSLTHCNYSHNFINKLPLVFQNFRSSFPMLEVLDLSHNLITVWDFTFQVTSLVKSTHIDLRYNNITGITLGDMETLKGLEPAFVDIRDNPISCDCSMKAFIKELKSGSVFEPNMLKYKYIENMTCVTPASFKGIRLKDFNSETLSCEKHHSHWSYPSVICASVTLIILLVILFCILYPNRELLKILCVTRLKVLPPLTAWDTAVKNYDVFIAASDDDEDWILDNLLCQLEDIELIDDTESARKTRKVKACVPGRDFRPGAFTVDEIIDKTEKSRRTFVVLSRGFVASRMCGEMLRQAYFQSIIERKCHLVFLKVEQIDLDRMDSTLRRSLKLYTVLDVTNRYFWDRIKFLLKTTSQKGCANNATTGEP
ncbi:toll-like receptor 4, partial [Haliotis asinina]|uniref:toll-like receptor 4 n=1 Tax=Haliotis asinina TaxID=109174 RepID=UPI0035324798